MKKRLALLSAAGIAAAGIAVAVPTAAVADGEHDIHLRWLRSDIERWRR